MSEENKKVIEDLLNINPRNMSYEQLASMQNGWWETLNLLSEQNKENKQLKDQLQQKENIIKELNDKIEDYKMIIEGNWGCIDNLKKDYNLQKNIIKEVREYIEKNWISQKDADNYRFDDEELDIEISDIAVLFDILEKENKQ